MAKTYGRNYVTDAPVSLHGKSNKVGLHRTGQEFHHWNRRWPILLAYYVEFVGILVYLKARKWSKWARLAVFLGFLPFVSYHLLVCLGPVLVFD